MDVLKQQRLLKQYLQTDRLLGIDAVPVNLPASLPSASQTLASSPAPASTSSPSSSIFPAEVSSAPAPPSVSVSPQPSIFPATPSSFDSSSLMAKSSKTTKPRSSPSTTSPTKSPARSSVSDPLAVPVLSTMPPGLPTKAVVSDQASPQDRTAFTQLTTFSQLLSRDQKITILHDLDQSQVRSCTHCELHCQRTQTVFGEGDVDSPILFIGEGPGENEDLQGRPFVGRAGELLEKMILALGLTREQVYIANTVKCRPPGNRTPTPAEIDSCWPFLSQQIQTIRPKVIVTLGGPATKTLLQTQTGITALRGSWHWFMGFTPQGPAFPVMPTFHPAYLLRAYTPENRKKVWEDLKSALALAKNEIILLPPQ